MKLTTKQVWWMGIASFACLFLAIWLNRSPTVEFVSYPDEKYDYIIVGAGTSGCVLAAKLAETGKKVLLLEAGSSPPWYSWIPLIAPIMQGSKSYDWLLRTVPQKMAGGALRNNQFNLPQGKMVGGSGQMNFLIHATGSPADFDSWDVPGWDSRSMKDVMDRLTCWTERKKESPRSVPSFILNGESETCSSPPTETGNSSDCHNPTKAQCPTAAIKIEIVDANESPLLKAFLDAGTLLGHRIGDMGKWDYGSAFMASHNTIDGDAGLRWNTYQSHLLPAMKRFKKLHVLRNALVNRIVLNQNRAVGVEYADENGIVRRIGVRKEVVLSSGSFKSAQILQLSGVGPTHILEPLDIPVHVDLPVGENLQDHLQVPLFVEVRKSVTNNVAKLLQPHQWWNFLAKGKGSLATSGIEGIATLGKLGSIANPKQPQGMLILFNMGSINADVYMSVANIKEQAFYNWFPKSGNMSQEGFVLISLCLHPRSRGHVRIRSTDPLHPPEIDPSYLSDSYDIDCMIETIKQGAALIETEPFKALGARLHWPSFPECGDNRGIHDRIYMECLVRMASLTMYHPSGTCAMGKAEDEKAVLDPRLRVRGLKNVRVVDASVLPALTSGPTNSILMAIAEKASQMIINDN